MNKPCLDCRTTVLGNGCKTCQTDKQHIARLTKALIRISELEVCDCDCYGDDEECPTCIALEALNDSVNHT